MTANDNPRAHLDQYAAMLRDLRQSNGRVLPGYATLPPGMAPSQASEIVNRLAGLARQDGFGQTAAAIAHTLTSHLPFVPAETIGAVLLDLSQFMLGFVAHPDAGEAAEVAAELPLLVAFVGQEMYGRAQ